jgi:hypothetical protein
MTLASFSRLKFPKTISLLTKCLFHFLLNGISFTSPTRYVKNAPTMVKTKAKIGDNGSLKNIPFESDIKHTYNYLLHSL